MLTDEERAQRIAALLELEQREHLFDYRVDRWSAWRVLRSPVYWMVEALPLATPPRSKIARTVHAILATFKLVWLLFRPPQRDLFVKTARTGLRVKQADKFRDVYFDGLLARGHTYLKLEEVNSDKFDTQAKNALFPSQLDPAVFTFWGKILGTAFPADAADYCQALSKSLTRDVGIDIDPRWLRQRISTAYWQSRMYGLLLKRIGAKAALTADTGDYALTIACRRKGVTFVELQHGAFNTLHPDAIPSTASGTDAELLMPHHLASRGTYWIGELVDTRQGQGIAVAVGDEPIDNARQRLQKRAPDRQLHVVVTSQGLDRQRLIRWIADIAATAPEEIACSLTINLHPAYDSGVADYVALRDTSRIRIISGNESPNVFELLSDADLHVSISSTCHFDAAALGVPTAVLPLAGHEQVLHAVDGQRFFLLTSPSDVWKIAATAGVHPDSGWKYAEPGFIENMERLLALPPKARE